MKETDLHRLRDKLCRELAQSELDASLQTTREANRLGVGEPVAALRAIAAHAEHLRPQLDKLLLPEQPIGTRVGRFVGHVFSALRHYGADRILSTERSYRATLLGCKHGLDTARLLRDVTRRTGDIRLERFCDDMIAERDVLVREAERALRWFATQPSVAMQSGARLAISSEQLPSSTPATAG
jgi:hypothetical protein